MIINLFRGFCMALADSVPGVSGGTIAFLLGFYDQFLASLNNIISGDKESRKSAVIFLLKLGLGWVIGMVSAVIVLTSMFEKHIYAVSSLFIGFVVFSIPLVIKDEKECLNKDKKNIIFLLLGIAIVTAITYFNYTTNTSGSGIDLSNLNIGLIIYVFLCGMVAISAMVLPGISGSTLLLIFGLYIPIMTGLKEVLHLNLAYAPALIVFALGVVTGILLVVKGIETALKKYRGQTIYLIIGLMIGSVYAIIMGATTLENPQPPMSWQTFNVLFFAIGAGIVFLLQKLRKVFEE